MACGAGADMGSFRKIDYSVRLKKNIERKLIAEFLAGLQNAFTISSYQYIGMGSTWFSDFILFHRTLRIQHMTSIECEIPNRVDFNKPFNWINVEPGESTRVLPHLDWTRRAIVWLDYDSELSSDKLQDLRTVTTKAQRGNIIIVTVNVHSGKIKRSADSVRSTCNTRTGDFAVQQEQRGVARMNEFNRLTEDFVRGKVDPSMFSNRSIDATLRSAIPEVLFAIIQDSCVDAGKGLKSLPLFSFFYNDGAPMVTIGTMLGNDNDEDSLNRTHLLETFCYLKREVQVSIDVPILTPKEKTRLDEIIRDEWTAEHRDALQLTEEEVACYRRFYRYYPTFRELL